MQPIANSTRSRTAPQRQQQEATQRQRYQRHTRPGVPPIPTIPNVPQIPGAGPAMIPINDINGHLNFRQYQLIANRYRMIKMLGSGTFGKVFQCTDTTVNLPRAIKVIRDDPAFREEGQNEVRVLNFIQRHERPDDSNCIDFYRSFDHQGHLCMEFELLGVSLIRYLELNLYRPLPLGLVQAFAHQIFTGVAFLHRIGLIHTDLKPENILLRDTKTITKGTVVLNNDRIRLIDFGSATFQNEHHSAVVTTKNYRAPEIILGMGWSYPCDIWSIGCILVELVTGSMLFENCNNLTHIGMMQRLIGPIPHNVIDSLHGPTRQFFFHQYQTRYINEEIYHYINGLETVAEKIMPADGSGNAQFFNLLQQIFQFNPAQRITAAQALHHPFFNLNL